MTPNPLHDIIEGKVAIFRAEIIHKSNTADKVEEHFRTAIKEAIIEGIESVVPEKRSHYSSTEEFEIGIPTGWNQCRAHILHSLQAFKEGL